MTIIKTRTIVYLMFVLLLFSLFIIASTDLLIPRDDTQVYDISVIISDSDGDRWSNFRSGMDQAAKEMNANISFVTLYDKNSLDQQIVLLKREIDDGADAILISAADSEGLTKELNDMVINIPIIAIDSNSDARQVISYISADNYKMGEKLGQEIILNSEETGNVLIIKSNMPRSNISERYQGLISVLNNSSHTYEVLNLDNLSDTEATKKRLLTQLKQGAPEIIVALEESVLECSLDAIEKIKLTDGIHLYGIGYTDRIVYNLEMEAIDGIVVQNTFNVGYLSIQNAVEAIKQRTINSKVEIEFRFVNKDNMYSVENQRLLFPVP